MKPGYKTTEFWFTAIAVTAGAIASSGLFDDTAVEVKIAALIATVLGALGYGKFRTDTKNRETEKEIARTKLAHAMSIKSKVPQPHREE